MLKYMHTLVGRFTFKGMRTSDKVYSRIDEGEPQVLPDSTGQLNEAEFDEVSSTRLTEIFNLARSRHQKSGVSWMVYPTPTDR